ncbi:MAG: hypothetical protein EB059_01675 [Alphaproteobacteria bacterium]|nr:hypothetical protein [Alphaproteobacteria bacterium]
MKRKFGDIFFVVFPLTAILFGALTYFLLNFKSLGPHGMMMALGLGVMCGMVFGIGVGYFVRSLEYAFDIDPSVDISTRLQLLLIGMGYRIDNQFQKIMTFQPTVRAGIFADRIRIEMMPGHIRMEGPHWHIEKIRATLGV